MQQDQQQVHRHSEQIARLEIRMDNHDIKVEELKRDVKAQTKQIFAGLGGLAVIVFIIELLFKTK